MLPFGQAILLWRSHRGLTQAELARRARLPQPNLSAIERGARDVSLRTIRALALALDVEPGVLVDGKSPQGPTSWSRQRLERVARAAVLHQPLSDKAEQSSANSLSAVLPSMKRVKKRGIPAARRTRRHSERAWLALAAGHSREEIQSLLARAEGWRSRRGGVSR